MIKEEEKFMKVHTAEPTLEHNLNEGHGTSVRQIVCRQKRLGALGVNYVLLPHGLHNNNLYESTISIQTNEEHIPATDLAGESIDASTRT